MVREVISYRQFTPHTWLQSYRLPVVGGERAFHPRVRCMLKNIWGLGLPISDSSGDEESGGGRATSQPKAEQVALTQASSPMGRHLFTNALGRPMEFYVSAKTIQRETITDQILSNGGRIVANTGPGVIALVDGDQRVQNAHRIDFIKTAIAEGSLDTLGTFRIPEPSHATPTRQEASNAIRSSQRSPQATKASQKSPRSTKISQELPSASKNRPKNRKEDRAKQVEATEGREKPPQATKASRLAKKAALIRAGRGRPKLSQATKDRLKAFSATLSHAQSPPVTEARTQPHHATTGGKQEDQNSKVPLHVLNYVTYRKSYSNRNEFTRMEDAALLERVFVNPPRKREWLKMYNQLAAEFGRHNAKAWAARYTKTLLPHLNRLQHEKSPTSGESDGRHSPRNEANETDQLHEESTGQDGSDASAAGGASVKDGADNYEPTTLQWIASSPKRHRANSPLGPRKNRRIVAGTPDLVPEPDTDMGHDSLHNREATLEQRGSTQQPEFDERSESNDTMHRGTIENSTEGGTMGDEEADPEIVRARRCIHTLEKYAGRSEAVEALLMCSGSVPLARRVLEAKVHDEPVPEQPGIWTTEDDAVIQGCDAPRIERVREKHGEEGSNRRMKVLRCLKRNGML